MHRTIKDEFRRFLKTVFPDGQPSMGSVQYQELRRCFYASFYNVLKLLAEDRTEEEMEESVRRWSTEALEFAKLTGEGRI